MKAPKITAVDAPRDFQVHELFFSTTDRKGVIVSGNDVFTRVSGYTETDLLGSPHNLIRHPDTPRAVFRLIWNYLLQGQAVAGYVKNLAADGRYYWVVAVITPLEHGYLSVRFKPTSPRFDTIRSLYAEMCRLEAAAIEAGETGSTGMDRATAHLVAALQAAGHADYEAFMATMLRDELNSRDAAIAAAGRDLVPAELAAADGAESTRLKTIYHSCHTAYREICTLYAGLDHYQQLDAALREGFAQVATLADGIRLVALNATIKAVQLGPRGHCTGVVAEFLARTSVELSGACGGFASHLRPVEAGLQSAVFNLAAARLQLEMILLFNQELARLGRLDESHGRDLDRLQTAFDGTIGPAIRGLQTLEQALVGFHGHSADFTKLTLNLQVAQTNGAIETSRLTDDDHLNHTFGELRQQTEGCRTETDRLDVILDRFDALAASSPAIIGQITAAIQATRRGVTEFVALLDANDEPAVAATTETMEALPVPDPFLTGTAA